MALIDSIMFYKAPGKKLVFARNDKCASTFYSNIFVKHKWSLISSNQVNWKEDYVFSFIIDPYVRHVKGLVQDLIQMGNEKILLQLMGQNFWHNLPWVGTHSMPFTLKFSGFYELIDWIPLDSEKYNAECIVSELLKTYDLLIDWSVPVFRNESNNYKQDLFQRLIEITNSEEKILLLSEIYNDYVVYNAAIDRYKHGHWLGPIR